MPLFAIWFTAAALMRRFNRPLLAWMTGMARDHVVLIGDTPVTRALAAAYRASNIGRTIAQRHVSPEHFPEIFTGTTWRPPSPPQ